MNGILTKKLYTYTTKEDHSVAVVLASESHPIFMAHFEGNPILPAFLHIDIAVEIFGLSISGISRSKFIEPLRPNDKLLVRCDQHPKGKKVIWSKEGKIASEVIFEVE